MVAHPEPEIIWVKSLTEDGWKSVKQRIIDLGLFVSDLRGGRHILGWFGIGDDGALEFRVGHNHDHPSIILKVRKPTEDGA